MSIRSARTGRHEDDIADAMAQGTATVQDVLEHAQEIIVETPEAFGVTTSLVVTKLLEMLALSRDGLTLDEADPINDLGRTHARAVWNKLTD